MSVPPNWQNGSPVAQKSMVRLAYVPVTFLPRKPMGLPNALAADTDRIVDRIGALRVADQNESPIWADRRLTHDAAHHFRISLSRRGGGEVRRIGHLVTGERLPGDRLSEGGEDRITGNQAEGAVRAERAWFEGATGDKDSMSEHATAEAVGAAWTARPALSARTG
jgi:hypothetical protein